MRARNPQLASIEGLFFHARYSLIIIRINL
jgi:hypothetical protein